MKRILSIALLVVLVMTLLPINTYATAETSTVEIIYLDDGSYITVELFQIETRASGTKTGSKTYRYRDSDGVEKWRAVLTGTFSYTGSSATCTASSCSVTISDSVWYVVSKSATKSGSSAIGNLTMGRKLLGVTVDKETITMRLTCDANGNLT